MYLVEELVHMYIHRREKRIGQTAPLVRNLSVRKSNHGEPSGEKSVTNSTADLIEPDSIKKGKVIIAISDYLKTFASFSFQTKKTPQL